jgi:hypothetical protein
MEVHGLLWGITYFRKSTMKLMMMMMTTTGANEKHWYYGKNINSSVIN